MSSSRSDWPQQDITLLVLASLLEKMSAALDGLNASSAKSLARSDIVIMSEIREFIEKQLDCAAGRCMAGDVAVPKHLAVRCAMEAAGLAAEAARHDMTFGDMPPAEDKREMTLDPSFLDTYARLTMEFLGATPGDAPDAEIETACLLAQRVVAGAVTCAGVVCGRHG